MSILPDAAPEPPAGTQANLRRLAEARLAQQWDDDAIVRSPEDVKRLLHELRVHQIELEIQNDELQRNLVALEAAEERYFDLYNLAPVGYLTLSQQGVILEANLTASNLLGVARDVIHRQPFTKFVIPDDQDIYYRCRTAIAKTGEPQNCELRLRHPTRGNIWVSLDATAAIQEDNDAWIQRITLSDITERKHAEAEREHLQKQLAQKQKLETIGRLAGGVANEFGNMLAVILMRAEMSLALVEPDSYLSRNLDSILATGQRAAVMVRQLLGYARKLPINRRIINLNTVIEEMLPALRKLAGGEIELSWRPYPALWWVYIDDVHVQQLLTILVNNARDAISGAGVIQIETYNRSVPIAAEAGNPAPGDYVVLAITDNGCGMDQQTLAAIFEPFFTTKEPGAGVGLGLPMVDGIVRQNRGHIAVTSEPKRGTAVRIYLQRAAEPLAGAALVRSSGTGNEHRETVLVVENSAAFLELTVDIIRHLGFNALAGATAEDAVRIAKEHVGPIDLLLTDISMPRMEGAELAKRITAVRPGTKVLFVSSYPKDIFVNRGRMEPDAYFLQKPYLIDELASAVASLLHAITPDSNA